jgi:hypothetical protein
VIFAGTDGDTRGPHVSAAELFELSLVLSDGRTLMGSHAVMAAGAQPSFFSVQAQPLGHLSSG